VLVTPSPGRGNVVACCHHAKTSARTTKAQTVSPEAHAIWVAFEIVVPDLDWPGSIRSYAGHQHRPGAAARPAEKGRAMVTASSTPQSSRARYGIAAIRNVILCLTLSYITPGLAAASGPLYRLTVIGGPEVTATAINSAGAVTGSIATATGSHVFLWDSGAMMDLGTIAGYDAVGLAINDTGDIVGTLSPQQGTGSLPFLYRNGVMTVLPTLDAGQSWCCYGTADAINNNGQVGGSSGMTSSPHHVPAIWTSGVPHALGEPIAAGSSGGVFGLNDYGQATGTDGVGPFVYSDGIVSHASGGVALNNAGQIVGDYYACSPAPCLPAWFARLYANGSANNLIGGGDDYGQAGGINNAGQVALYAVTAGSPPPYLYLYSDGLLPFYDVVDPTDPLYSPYLVIGDPGDLNNTNRPAINDNGWIVTRGDPGGNNSPGPTSFLLIPTTRLPAFVRLFASVNSIEPGGTVTLSWVDQSVSSCAATGGSGTDGWAGMQPTHGGQTTIHEGASGPLKFTMTCESAAGAVASSATVVVEDASGSSGSRDSDGAGGGGVADLAWLLTLTTMLLGRPRPLPQIRPIIGLGDGISLTADLPFTR
jgi:probable HAF family extracellular repeat protein